ncbi:hypothetical protein EX895_000677 [Sporisorium graminicola]|uniref:Uncharacterized protein n=1 Tax=Sporisorium graminicola TaxID=280036 RepID=A0A4V6EUP6_9BASI|nr:hypothetical protein EX895_000677 [Sporisorium graminicola]TKY90679.1 hypothetical protein EX895_000677 [Sporisorium graminicola]
MTLHSAREHAGPSRTHASRVGATDAAQSLADLYNSRHAQESAASSSSSSRHASPSSLVNLYNRRHHAEVRKNKVSSTSLADLYNHRYENEHQDQNYSVEQVLPRRRQVISSRAKSHTMTGASTALSAPKTILSALSIDDTDDVGELKSLLPNGSDGLQEDDHDEEEDEVDFHSTPTHSGRSRSQTRSQSGIDFQESAELVYVARSSIPRRGALGSSATRLTMDSDDEMESVMPPASGSSNVVLARPHPSSSQFVVQSSGSGLMDPISGLSTPLIPPHHRKGLSVPQHLLESTQEEEASTSTPAAVSGAETAGAEHEERDSTTLDKPLPLPHDIGPPEGIIVISDSSFDQPYEAHSLRRPSHFKADAVASAAETPELSTPEEADMVVLLQSPSKRLQERAASEQTSSGADSKRHSPSLGRPSWIGRDMQSELDSGQVSDADSDVPVITSARIIESRTGASSEVATESESDAQRRYPRRARNVADYNVRRAFDRYDGMQGEDQEDLVAVERSHPKTMPQAPVIASPAFFEALRSGKASRTAGLGRKPPSFAEFLMSKTKAVPAAGSTSISVPRSIRSAGPSAMLTEAQVRALLKPTIGLFNITVDTQDHAGVLGQKLNASRGELQPDATSSDKDGVQSPSLPASGTPIDLTFRSIIPLHLRRDKLTPAELREMLDSLGGTGPIGRPRNATDYESASRRLRLGRAYNQHLPDALRTFTDMEHQEWVRLEEYLPEVRQRVEEQRAREQGRIMVEMDSSEMTRTQYDHMGRKLVSTLHCVTGGLLKMYFKTKESDGAAESPGYRIVRTRSTTKSPSLSRLASTPVGGPESDDSVFGAGADEGQGPHRDGTPVRQPMAGAAVSRPYSSMGTRESIMPPKPATNTPPAANTSAPSKAAQPTSVPLPTLPQLFQRTTEARAEQLAAQKNKAVARRSSAAPPSKPTKATASKGTRDLFSYFSTTQSSSSQPATKSASASISASTSKPATSSTSKKPATAIKRSTAPQAGSSAGDRASAIQKGKQRALDEDIKVWSISSRSTDSDVEVVIDLTRSSSAADSLGASSKRARSPSPLTAVSSSKKRKALVSGASGASGSSGAQRAKKVVVGLSGGSSDRVVLGSKAEGRRREAEQHLEETARSRDVMTEVDVLPMVDVPTLPHADVSSIKRKRPLDEGATASSSRPRARTPAEQPTHIQHPSTPPTITSRPSTNNGSSSSSTSARRTAPPGKSKGKSGSRSRSGSSSSKTTGPPLPAATPSPTRGGWKGISGWYTNTHDDFSTTPDERLSQREIEKQHRLSKLDQLLSGMRRPKRREQ